MTKNGTVMTEYCPTDKQAADIFTKAFTDKNKWMYACSQVGLLTRKPCWKHMKHNTGQVDNVWIESFSKPPGIDRINATRPPPPGSGPEWRQEHMEKDIDELNGNVATTRTPAEPRLLIEFCCSKHSKMGNFQKLGRITDKCEIIRLTIDEDMTTESGLQFAQEAITEFRNRNPDYKHNILIWSAIPCTGGSTWQYMNQYNEGGVEKIEQHKRIYRLIWNNLDKLIRFATIDSIAPGIAIEWPTRCSYWKDNWVQAVITKYDLKKHRH